MTQYQNRKGNRIIKHAYLSIIENMMVINGSNFVWLNEGFENDSQRIHFTSEGHRCILEGIARPNPSTGDITLKVVSERGRYTVDLNASSIHIRTLEKFAEAVYNALWNPEKNEEWDIYRDKIISGYLDTFM